MAKAAQMQINELHNNVKYAYTLQCAECLLVKGEEGTGTCCDGAEDLANNLYDDGWRLKGKRVLCADCAKGE